MDGGVGGVHQLETQKCTGDARPSLSVASERVTQQPSAVTTAWPYFTALGIFMQLASVASVQCHHRQPASVRKASLPIDKDGHRPLARKHGPSTTTPLGPVFRRTMSSAPALRCLYVTQGMAACLGFHDMMEYSNERLLKASFGRQSQATVLATCTNDQKNLQSLCGSPGNQACPASPSSPGFRMTLTMRDPAGHAWPVVYEATLTSRQYHRRLTNGWREFCRHHHVRHGDVVAFRRCAPGDPDTMTVRVVRRGRE